jgi:hypothetical protein
MALSVALFVGCKKEKEQKGPSLTPAGETGVVTAELTTLAPNTDTTLRFKLIAQKGSGKDDADLKDYSFTVEISGIKYPVYTNRPALDGRSFTIDTTVRVRGEDRDYIFTVTDKNGKSASRTFKITFRSTSGDPGGPMMIVDTLYGENYTNRSDNRGTHLRYQVGSAMPLMLQGRDDANSNPSKILFVYWYSSASQKHSVISPAILRDPIYDNTPPKWNNTSTLVTNFVVAPSSVNFTTAGYNDIRSAYNNGTPVNDFPNNDDQRAECRTDRPVLAFKQVRDQNDTIYGLIRVESVRSGGDGARLSVKVARP